MPSAHPLIDHEEIRRWAEARRAKPSCVRRTGGKGDPGMIRLDFPGFSGAQSLSPISWNEWFKAFDENNLALIVQDRTARGQQSNFNKLVSRESITEGLPPRRERKREGRGSSRGAHAVAADRKTSGRKTSGRKTSSGGGSSRRAKSSSRSNSSSRGSKSSSRSASSSRSGSSRSRKTSSARAGSSKSRGQKSPRRSSSSSSRSKASDSTRSSNSGSRKRRSSRTSTRGGDCSC